MCVCVYAYTCVSVCTCMHINKVIVSKYGMLHLYINV